MFDWYFQWRAWRERVRGEAAHLVDTLGAGAYEYAREQRRDAQYNDQILCRFWTGVAREIARRDKRGAHLDTSSRYLES